MEQIGLQAILDDKNFQAGMRRYEQGIGQMEKATDSGASVLSRIGGIMGGAVVVGAAAAVAAFGAVTAASKMGLDATLKWSEDLEKMNKQFGLTGPQASGWIYLMDKIGLSIDEGGAGLNYFTRSLDALNAAAKNGKPVVTPFSQALDKLGVNARTSGGRLKTFDEIMPEIMDHFEKLPAGVEATGLAMDMFGARGWNQIPRILAAGQQGIG